MKRCCDGCNDKFELEDLSDVTSGGENMLFCPRCVFIVALYHVNGVDKDWTRGSIHPSLISNKIRKIVENEFYKNPAATYKKYLGEMIERQEVAANIVHVSADVVNRLREFPFVFMAPADAERYKLERGAEVVLDAGDVKVRRRLYGFTTIKGRYLKKYGRCETSTVLFLPEVYDDEKTVA